MGPFGGFHDVSMFSVVFFFMVNWTFSSELGVLFCWRAKTSPRTALEPTSMWLIPSAGMVAVTMLAGPTALVVRNGQGGVWNGQAASL